MKTRCRPGSIALFVAVAGLILAGLVVSCEKSSAPGLPNEAANSGGPIVGSAHDEVGAASLTTDASDYNPGDTVTFTGSGFDGFENVTLQVLHLDGHSDGEGHEPWTATADESGAFEATWIVCGDDCRGSSLLATADGELSTKHAEATFTDALGTGRVSSVVPVDGGCVALTTGGNRQHWDVQEGKTYLVTLTNVTECTGAEIQVLVKSSETGNQCLTATQTGDGEYQFQVVLPSQACNTMPIIYCVANCSEATGLFARQPDGDGFQGHLRMATFDGSCNLIESDTDCGGDECSLSIECPSDLNLTCSSEVPAGDPAAPTVTVTGTCPATPVVTFDDVRENEVCANHYTLLRTYTVTSGTATASCTQTIEVNDDVPPQVECPQDISVQLMPGDPCLPIVHFEATGTDNCGGTVTVTFDPPSDTPFPIGTTVVTATAHDACGNASTPCTFNVVVWSSACGVKFYDYNVNGINDDGQVVPGWQINLSGAANSSVMTDASGHFCFIGLNPGSYTVSEVVPGGWIATTPTSRSFDLGCPQNVEFGNVCLGANGAARTIGYWSNKNGATTMNDGGSAAPELALLTSLCLRNANGTDFNPTTVAQYQSWLLSANAVNMAFMLSAQLSAMELNVEAGFVNGNSLVYAGGCGNTGVGNQFISINDLMVAAANALCADGYTPDGDPNRAAQECLKNALDKANNNTNFVSPKPCTLVRASSTKLGM